MKSSPPKLSQDVQKKLGQPLKTSKSYFTTHGPGGRVDLTVITDPTFPFSKGIPTSELHGELHAHNGTEVQQRIEFAYADQEDHAKQVWTRLFTLQELGNNVGTGVPRDNPLRGPFFLRVSGAALDTGGSSDGELLNASWTLDGWEYTNGWLITIGFINQHVGNPNNPQAEVIVALTKAKHEPR